VLNIQQRIIFWSILRCGRKKVHVRYLISWWVLVCAGWQRGTPYLSNFVAHPLTARFVVDIKHFYFLSFIPTVYFTHCVFVSLFYCEATLNVNWLIDWLIDWLKQRIRIWHIYTISHSERQTWYSVSKTCSSRSGLSAASDVTEQLVRPLLPLSSSRTVTWPTNVPGAAFSTTSTTWAPDVVSVLTTMTLVSVWRHWSVRAGRGQCRSAWPTSPAWLHDPVFSWSPASHTLRSDWIERVVYCSCIATELPNHYGVLCCDLQVGLLLLRSKMYSFYNHFTCYAITSFIHSHESGNGGL